MTDGAQPEPMPEVLDMAAIAGVGDALNLFNRLTTEYQNYLRLAQEEETKRAKIHVWGKLQIQDIRARRDVLIKYLDRSFDERKENFQRLFDRLDKATDENSVEVAINTLNTIVDLAKSSPFQAIGTIEDARKFLTDPNAEFELEF